MLGVLLMAGVAAAGSVTTKMLSSPSYITVPLSVTSGDHFYNAMMTDSTGNEMGVRLDILQPDVWLINGNSIINCEALDDYYYTLLDYLNLASSMSYSGQWWAVTECELDGAYFPVVTATTTSDGTAYKTLLTLDFAGETGYSIPYPNGVTAEGHVMAANLLFGTTDNTEVKLSDFSFLLADETNMFAGGLGLADHPQGLGLLQTLVDRGAILSAGYLTFFSNFSSDNSAGELLLGAVNKKYYTGDFYQFPVVPYVGLDSSLTLPTIMLDGITLENSDTSQLVLLMLGDAQPFLLDLRLAYSYMPLLVLVNLAVQTNAYYNEENERWIIKCLDLADSTATMNFKFGPLTVDIPISAFSVDAYYNDNYLYFSSGVRACFLNVLPSQFLGYNTLGLPFITNAYFAMDNEGGHIGLANVNPDLDISSNAYAFLDTALMLYNGTATPNNSTTAAYIVLGSIPFATMANYTTNVTMTISTGNSTGAEAIPSRFSGVTIASGEVYITGANTVAQTSDSASAANARTSSGSGALRGPVSTLLKEKSWVYVWVVTVGFTSVLILM